MIFRKTPENAKPTSPLQRIQNRINSEISLKMCILEAFEAEGVLVVLCSESRMKTFVKLALEKHWIAGVEVYCASEMMTGGAQSAELSGDILKSRYYLN